MVGMPVLVGSWAVVVYALALGVKEKNSGKDA